MRKFLLALALACACNAPTRDAQTLRTASWCCERSARERCEYLRHPRGAEPLPWRGYMRCLDACIAAQDCAALRKQLGVTE